GAVMIKVPFTSLDLESWERNAKGYRTDPIGVAKHFQYLVTQHNPDWSDIQLMLDSMTETEKQLILRKAEQLVEDHYKGTGIDLKDHFPLQDPHWDPNRSPHKRLLEQYRDWVAQGIERAIPKTINWSVLFSIRQGPNEAPSEFLE
ncbi:hypothetical protein N321_00052, partial [Antrostomus carolinensis]